MIKITTSQGAGSARATLSFRRLAGYLGADQRGVAAVEFGFIASFLVIAALNVSDVAIFLFDQMQVNNATQMGAQAGFTACDFNHLPATTNCLGLSTAITTAIQSTPLGTTVALKTGSPSEAYYCVNSSGALQNVGSVSASKPTDCTAAGVSSTKPGDYIVVQTTYTFAPLFRGVSVGSLLPATITDTAWARLG